MSANVIGRPSLLAEIQHRLRYENRERWFRHVLLRQRKSAKQGFFDSYPRFFETSVTWAKPDRLNQRHRALIQSNADVIVGNRVLDLASHDGRWSFAAHKAGAQHVLGIEARDHLVEAANSNMREYGAPANKVEFMKGDVLADLDQFEPGRFDTVFCFGFLYHTIEHMPLLRKIARLKPKHLIIDTLISVSPAKIVEIKEERIGDESNGAVGEPGTPTSIVIGKPSRSALELMLRATGFPRLRYYDWLNAGITRWDDLQVYYMGQRISVTAQAALEKR